MARPKIKITVKERKGNKNCHRGHKIEILMILIQSGQDMPYGNARPVSSS